RRDVVEQRPVGVVADRGDHRDAQERDGAAQRLVAEREQVGERASAPGDDHHVDGRARREVLQRARDRGSGVAGPYRRGTPAGPPPPPRRPPARRAARPAPAPRVRPPRPRGPRGRASAFWGANGPSPYNRRRSCSSWASRSPSPATRSSVTANENDGEAVRE